MVSRRQVLAGVGGFVVAAGVTAVLPQSMYATGKSTASSWLPRKLDPEVSAAVAYEGYWEEGRGCGYGAFKGIIGVMGRYGEPYSRFPVWMMAYASAGIGKWGTVCGALNCAAAAFGLLYQKKDLEQLVDALFSWYEKAALPEFIPKNPRINVETEKLVTDSVLCHVSLSRWCYETDNKVNSMERAERCSRVVADVTRKAVELLNGRIDKAHIPRCFVWFWDSFSFRGSLVESNEYVRRCDSVESEACRGSWSSLRQKYRVAPGEEAT